MEQFRNIIHRYEDTICAALQLVICFMAVLLALKNDRPSGGKQTEKLIKSKAKLRQKMMKEKAKQDRKLLKQKYRAKLRSVKKAQAKKRA